MQMDRRRTSVRGTVLKPEKGKKRKKRFCLGEINSRGAGSRSPDRPPQAQKSVRGPPGSASFFGRTMEPVNRAETVRLVMYSGRRLSSPSSRTMAGRITGRSWQELLKENPFVPGTPSLAEEETLNRTRGSAVNPAPPAASRCHGFRPPLGRGLCVLMPGQPGVRGGTGPDGDTCLKPGQ